MAQYLVLEDFAGNIRQLGGTGSSARDIVSAGTLLDSTVYDIAYILGQGCPMVLYNAETMAAALAAFLVQDPGVANVSPDGNLIGLLIAFGAIGGGGTPGTVQEFTFRPGSTTNATLGIYATWAELMTAISDAATASLEYVILVDLATLGTSFAVPAGSYILGGKATLRGTGSRNSALHLQFNGATVVISGVAQIDNFLICEATGLASVSSFVFSAGTTQILLTRGAAISSSASSNSGAIIQVPAGVTLNLIMLDGASILNPNGVSALRLAAGGSCALVIGDDSSVADDSISGLGGSTLTMQKGSPGARIPATLSDFAGTWTRTGQVYSLPHASFGAQNVPLAAGAYFLPYGGNDAITVLTTTDQPFRETLSYGGRLRLLTIAQLWAVANAGGSAVVTVEILLNGVLVPGMTNAAVNLNALATTPIQLTASNPPILAVGDTISVRVTVPGGGITATCTDLFCVVETT